MERLRKSGYKVLLFLEKIKYESILIDFLFLVVVVLSIFLDLEIKSCPSSKQFLNFKFNETTLILTDLLPLAMTILSIVISLTKDEVYGLSLRELNKISKPNFFNLLHIYLISIISFLFNLSFIYFELKLSTMVLQVVCLIYCFIFGIQQFGLIYHNGRAIKGIIRFKYKVIDRGASSDDASAITNSDRVNKLITNILYEEGLFVLYKMIRKNNMKLRNKEYNFGIFKYILSIEINYFEELFQEVEKSNLNKGDLVEFESLNVLDSINKGYESLKEIAEIIQIEKFYDKDNEFYLNYARLSFLLHDLATEFNIKEDKPYMNLFDVFEADVTGKKNENIMLYMSLMVVNSLKHNDLWFVKIYRKFITKGCNILYSKYYPFYVFTNFLMIFLISNLENETNLKEFMSESYKDINDKNINWKGQFVTFSKRLGDEKRLALLQDLLYIYDNMNYIVGFYYQYKCSENQNIIFTKEMIFQYWSQFILFCITEKKMSWNRPLLH